MNSKGFLPYFPGNYLSRCSFHSKMHTPSPSTRVGIASVPHAGTTAQVRVRRLPANQLVMIPLSLLPQNGFARP